MAQSKDLDQHGCLASYNSAAKLFNQMLDHMCEKLRIELRDATIIYVDIYAIKYSLIANSKTYGKSRVTHFSSPSVTERYGCNLITLVMSMQVLRDP